jgi:hypothetical protein
MSEDSDIAAAVTHHENAPSVAPESVESVAALAGLISSSLTEMDSRSVGGDSIHANKLDKKALAQELTAIKRTGGHGQHASAPHAPQSQPHPPPHVPSPEPQVTSPPAIIPPAQPTAPSPTPNIDRIPQVPKTSTIVDKKELTAIRRRLKKLEEEHKVLKKIIEFKPLYKKYYVKTDAFEGEVNNITYLLDILVKELAKKPSDIIIKAK